MSGQPHGNFPIMGFVKSSTAGGVRKPVSTWKFRQTLTGRDSDESVGCGGVRGMRRDLPGFAAVTIERQKHVVDGRPSDLLKMQLTAGPAQGRKQCPSIDAVQIAAVGRSK